MTDKLKPCPWCGSEAVMRSYESHLHANSTMYSARCSNEWCCKCPSGWHKSKKTATKRWNARASDDATQQIIKAVVQAWDVVDGAGCPQRTEEGYLLNNDEAIIEFMEPHLQALKGLIDGKID